MAYTVISDIMESPSASEKTLVVKSKSTRDSKSHSIRSNIIPHPFELGRTLVFKTMSTSGSKRYLNSSASAERSRSVYLSDSIDFNENPGCHWKSIKLDNNFFHFESQSTSGERIYLDSSTIAPSNISVYLYDESAGDGSQWKPTALGDDSYSLESKTPSGPKRFMNSSPSGSTEASVYMETSTHPIGTHWMMGMDYFTSTEIEDHIRANYPGIVINIYMSDPDYGSLDFDLLHGIWFNSHLGSYHPTEHKFDCDDFAAVMKAEVSKYSYHQTKPTNRGSLCGIIWGRNALISHAYNFTVDPFLNLILFEPRNGELIDLNEYVPYLCVV